MRKSIRAIVLALMLAGMVSGPVAMTGCSSIGGVFETDPVGATLVTIKDAYESSVRTAGRLYVNKQISEAQLRQFRDEANKFHALYTAVVAEHEAQKLSPENAQFKALQLAIASLEALVTSFLS
jgi:hypothetical protein